MSTARDLEKKLASEAERLGLPLSEYALRVLSSAGRPASAMKTGADLVAYWQAEGLIGTRPEIADSAEHARAIRREAERRLRP